MVDNIDGPNLAGDRAVAQLTLGVVSTRRSFPNLWVRQLYIKRWQPGIHARGRRAEPGLEDPGRAVLLSDRGRWYNGW